MEYLLKSSAVIFIFYILYKLLLQRETFFQANRSYLLIGLITAISIPFVVIPIYIEYTPAIVETTIPLTIEVQQNTQESIFNVWQLLYVIYGLGLAFFLGKLLIELASLKFLFNEHEFHKNGSYTLIETDKDIPPFSFFNWIVFNPNKYSEDELNHILNHEKAHVRELHSIDIMLTQIACILFWFNPFIWLYKKEVQQNLEFIADKKAQDFSECQKSYQTILLKSSVPMHKFLITNNFYNSQIKKRIIMLHKSKSNKLNAWKYVLILPALALFLMSFNTKEIFIETNNPIDLSEAAQTEASNYLNNFYNNIELNNEEKPKPLNKTNPSKNNTKKNNKLIPQATLNTQKESTKRLEDISVTVINKNTTDAELDKIKNSLEKEGLTVKFKGIKRNSKGEITAIKITAKSKTSSTNYQISSDDETIEPIKIVFDEENNSISIGNGHSSHGDNKFVYSIDGENHQIHKSGSGSHVYVISDDEHQHGQDTVYVTRAKGKKGKVKTIKSSKKVHVISGDDDEVIEIIVDDNHNHSDEEEIIIVNGKKVNVSNDKDNIVVKGKSKNVWISKDGGNEDVVTIQKDDSKRNIFISGDHGKNPLFILDGKEVSKEKFADIDPDDIESVTVLKDKNAIEKYGDKGKNGVIIVKTKKKN